MCQTASGAEEFVSPRITAVQIAVAPKIDGVLDDECWQECPRFTGFIESAHSGPATEETEVMLCRDADSLYVALICHDSRPSLIHAEQTQRDHDLSNDDHVAVLVDSRHEHFENYLFGVNPLGVQTQTVPSGSASNITWRGDWYAGAKITDTGWCAEIEIPFRALRYPDGADTFGIVFGRYIPRLDEESNWPDPGPVVDRSRFADLVELELPKHRARPVLLPYTITSTEPGRSFTRVGFDFKEELPNNVVAMTTYNPDFTDVQEAVASIDYSYTERYLSEHRPFFQEGSGLFPDSTAFYSRRIGDIDWGVKSFGRAGAHGFSFLNALKQGQENHWSGVYCYDPTQDAGFSVWYTGSAVKDAYKQDPSEPDTSMCFAPGGYLTWRAASGSTTLAARHYSSINSDNYGSGSCLTASLARTPAAGNFGYSLAYEDTDDDYYVRDAYVPLPGVRGTAAKVNYFDRPGGGTLTYWDAYVTSERYRLQDGSPHHDSVAVGASFQTGSEWAVGTYLMSGSYLGAKDSTALLQVGWLTRHLNTTGSLGYSVGKRAGDDYTYSWIDQAFRITPKLTLTCGFEWTRLGPDSDSQFTVLGSYDINPERNFGLWAVGRDSDVNLCVTYKQTVRSGSDIYLIYGYPNTQTTERRIALKVVTPLTW